MLKSFRFIVIRISEVYIEKFNLLSLVTPSSLVTFQDRSTPMMSKCCSKILNFEDIIAVRNVTEFVT